MPINQLIATAGGYRPPQWDYASNQTNQLAMQERGLRNQLLQQQVESYPEEQAERKADREYKQKLRKYAEEDRPLERQLLLTKIIRDQAPSMNWGNYAQKRERLMSELNLPPEAFPEPGQILQEAQKNKMSPEEYLENWKYETTMTLTEHLDLLKAKQAEETKYGPAAKGFETHKARAKALAEKEFGTGEDAKQSDVTKYELVTYGKLSPQLRGTPEYKKGFLAFQRDIKEQSPYVDALNRQIDVTAKREGSALRKEFYDSLEVKTYQEVSRQAGVMAEAMKESESGKNMVAVDQALITIMNKMMDPSSVVRESEYARTPGDLPLMNRVKGAFAKIKKGGAGLTKEDREAISTMGKKYMAETEKKYKAKLHEYKGYLSNYGLDPDKYLKPTSAEEDKEDLSTLSNEEILKKLETK